MARTVKPEEFSTKRNEILDVAQRLIMTNGYEQVAIRDILEELGISSGAFHHYFDSRADLLDGLTDRIQTEVETQLRPILDNPKLTAIEKFQGFFDTLDRLRVERKSFIIKLLHVWYTDANAVMRQKVEEAVIQQRTALLTEIIELGVREGVFTTPYPQQAGGVILALLQGMGATHAQLILSFDHSPDKEQIVTQIIQTHAAYMDAVERVLGAPSQVLYRAKTEEVRAWLEN
jgi:AcrR family transcriptional regulator